MTAAGETGAPRDFATTDAQRAIWAFERLRPELDLFSGGTAATADGPLDAALLERALAGIVERHETLRTTFHASEGQPVQRIHSAMEVPIQWQRVVGMGDAELQDRLIADSRRPYDLERGPLLRVCVYDRGTESVVLVGAHHINADLITVRLLLEELEERYVALRGGLPPALEPLSRQFREHAAWQNAMIEGEEGRRHAEYWRERLAGPAPDLAMPLDHPRPPVEVHRGASVSFELPAELVGRLEEIARPAGATLYSVLLGAFIALLHRYSGESTITVGSYSSGRVRRDLKPMAGLVSNPIPLRVSVATDLPFIDLVREVGRSLRGALRHQFYPLSRMAQRLDRPRDPSRSPIFQAVFNLDRPEPPRSVRSWRQEPWLSLLLRSQEGQFELKLMAAVRQDGSLVAALQYQTALYEAASVERLARSWRALLEDVAGDSSRAVANLALLDRAETTRVLVDWNRTERAYGRDTGVHELVRKQIERTPDAVAVCHGEDAITYAELGRRVAHLARQLRHEGAGPGSLVGICLEPSIRQVTALLAVLETGGAYLPLDPSHPRERRRSILEDAGARLLMEDTPAVDGFAAARPGPRVVSVKRLPGAPADQRRAPDELPGGGEQRAYVLFTSGSTGKPKGVEISHRSLVNLLEAMQDLLQIGPADTWLSITTLSFDIAALELFLPLVHGARLALADRDVAGSGRRLGEEIERHGATVVQATPTSWRLLHATGRSTGRLTRLCGGEALTRALADRLLGDPGPLWNLYGPTETTIWSTASRVQPGDRPPAIGRPLANTQAYVLDAGMRPVPVGVVGELWIGGEGVAIGYLGRPELTAERFVPDPYRTDPGARLYRSGDLTRWLASGELEFCGRLDHQVKVRGIRIELGEIETALLGQPEVVEAVVTARTPDEGEAQLAAYIVSAPGRRPDPVALRQRLRERLPDYMVPASFTYLDAMPLTANRKIDRRALPDPALATTRIRFASPRSPVESHLALMFAEVLALERVGIDDDFFELGGASIASLELAARAEKAGIVFAPEAVFEHRTIRSLAAAISGAMMDRPAERRVARQRQTP